MKKLMKMGTNLGLGIVVNVEDCCLEVTDHDSLYPRDDRDLYLPRNLLYYGMGVDQFYCFKDATCLP